MTGLLKTTRIALFTITAIILVHSAIAQGGPTQLRVKNFVLWGGSSPAGSYDSLKGVFIGESVTIPNGSIGTHQKIEAAADFFSITGNIISGNKIQLGSFASVSGNIVANNTANGTGDVIYTGSQSVYAGNISAKGRVNLGGIGSASSVTGQVSVPAPISTNYSGPAPAGGFDSTLTLPILPVMPAKKTFTPGGSNISFSQVIVPGSYKSVNLTGGDSLIFNGPGTYVFQNINNTAGAATRFIFDFQASGTGVINIYIAGDAKMGNIVAIMRNGGSATRIYTEVHGNGSTNFGRAFEILGQAPAFSATVGSNWVGTVYAPDGDIFVGTTHPGGPTATNISGALWSGTRITIEELTTVNFQQHVVDPSFVLPYYPPPADGKVADKIGAELRTLHDNYTTIVPAPDNVIYRLDTTDQKVYIEVIAASLSAYDTLKAFLLANGLSDTVSNGPGSLLITGRFPVAVLDTLNYRADIDYVRPLYLPLTNTGTLQTLGDVSVGGDLVKLGYEVRGDGVKVGVLSDSYDTKLSEHVDISNGDLPGGAAAVQNVMEYPFGEGLDEGRAMLQIIHDVAPQASLASQRINQVFPL